jgi:hypothetical protein
MENGEVLGSADLFLWIGRFSHSDEKIGLFFMYTKDLMRPLGNG